MMNGHIDIIHRDMSTLISHQVLLKSFCRSQLFHESVNLSFTFTSIKHKFTDL